MSASFWGRKPTEVSIYSMSAPSFNFPWFRVISFTPG